MGSEIAKHVEEYSQQPQVVIEVPGVTVLFGEFADYCKGFSICAANDLKLVMAVSKREDSLVKMSNAFSGDHKRFSLSGIKFRKEDRWGNYIKGVIQNLLNSNATLCGLNISLTGNLLSCDTESVCSALGVATALAVNKLFDLKMDRGQIIRHVYLAATGFSLENCKYMTLFTMLDARENELMFFDNQAVSFTRMNFPNNSPECRFYILESRIPPIAMREELAQKTAAMKKAFEILRNSYPNTSLREIPESELSERVIQIDEESRQICSYILDESKVSRDAFKAFEAQDLPALGKLLGRIQKGLRDKLDLTCPEVDWLVKRANEVPGCLGACMVPTGLSGSILLLMNESAEAVYSQRQVDYEHIFGFNSRKKEFHSCGCAHIVLPQ